MSFKAHKLKYHPYFLNSVFARRPYLTEEKIQNVLVNFEDKEIQENGRIAYHGYDLDAKKFLKVVVEIENSEQIIFNAYYNRSYKPKSVRTM
jgi:hypothetical protein